MQRSPGKSTRKAAAELGISRRSVQRILKNDLHLFPYKITVLHGLTARDKQSRLEFAEWTQREQMTMHNVWFSDEAHFHLNGVVNKQNVRFWASENPYVISEKVRHAPRVTVWVAISSHGIIGPFFFNETVNAERYLDVLGNSFVPHLIATGLPFDTQWFMQDGATPHTANAVLDVLHETFGPRVISHRYPARHGRGQSWPPNSPDINPCDYFLWGYLKEKVFPQKPATLVELRAVILAVCREITEDMCRRVITNVGVRVAEVIRQNGGHIEHVLRR